MTYAIDELAPWMWVFIIILGITLLIAGVHELYVWVAQHPCDAYRLVAHWWGPIGDHCVGY
jgi:hypothetical protein